ncbi:phage antirepressor N-terminal domain-containing protein [Proteus terrae]|uniref:phage antirepressor N-terminal domain-containing protein n=1 Tax=Proteus terrae TaxID=1574161 RepID=UPI00288B7B00|nr:phage antirepressor N-terminal domain-containing protein [Proteus terrae]
MNNSISTINVPFHGANLCIVNRDGNPYVPMKPIIEDMGLDWASQFTKLKKRFSKGIVEITIPSKGGEQSMICLAMHKLTGWLYSIMPNKVKPEIRDKVIKYQEECDDVLYEYWTTGEVKKKHKSTVQERNPLKNAVNLLVSKKGIMYPEAYSLVHQKFNVSSIEELTADQIPDAVEYIHKFVLEGEYIPKQKALSATKLDINYPLTWYPETFPFVKMCFFNNGQLKMTQSMLNETKSPSCEIFQKLESAGYEVSAAKAEFETLRHTMIEMSYALREISTFAKMKDTINKVFNA